MARAEGGGPEGSADRIAFVSLEPASVWLPRMDKGEL